MVDAKKTMEVEKKFGLLIKPNTPTDYHRGLVSGITSSVLQENRNWENFLPEKEYQFGNNFDTKACVTFSALNCLEILLARQYGYSVNYSDRFAAKTNNTTRDGNYLHAVANSLRHDGIVFETIWPWNRTTFDWDDFYAPIDAEVIAAGKLFLNSFTIQYEWVTPTPETLWEALGEAPLQVTHAYVPSTTREAILPRTERPEQHATTLFNAKKGEWWECFDHYDSIIKRYAWDFKFWTVLKYNITRIKEKVMLDIQNNTLVQETEESGQFGLYLDGKIFVDDPKLQQLGDPVLRTLIMRTSAWPQKRVLKKAEWQSLPKYNFKGTLLQNAV